MERAGIRLFDREGGRFAPDMLVDGLRNPVEIIWRNIGTGEIFDPVAYIISANLRRRHLDESQRALVAAKIATLRQGARTDLASIEAKSQSAAADLLNVSRSSVQRAREVIDRGAPNIVSAVERGEVSVSAAATAVKAAPKDTQQNWSADDIKRIAKEATRNPPPLSQGDETRDDRVTALAERARQEVTPGEQVHAEAAATLAPTPSDAGRIQNAILNAYLALKATDNADLRASRRGLDAIQIDQALEYIEGSFGRLRKLQAALRGEL